MEPVFKLTHAENKLAELLWRCEPIASMELIQVALKEFGWKKSTTFSVLKVLINKGVAQNLKSTVTMLCTKEQFITAQNRRYIDATFDGSLPKFLVSFFGEKPISAEEAAELRKLIDAFEGDGENG